MECAIGPQVVGVACSEMTWMHRNECENGVGLETMQRQQQQPGLVAEKLFWSCEAKARKQGQQCTVSS